MLTDTTSIILMSFQSGTMFSLLISLPCDIIHKVFHHIDKPDLLKMSLINKELDQIIKEYIKIPLENSNNLTYHDVIKSSVNSLNIQHHKLYTLSEKSDVDLDFKIFQYLYHTCDEKNKAQFMLQLTSYFHETYIYRLKSIYGRSLRLPQYCDIEFTNIISKIDIYQFDINLYNIYSIYVSYNLLNTYNYKKQFSSAVLDDVKHFMLIYMTDVYSCTITDIDKQVSTIESLLQFNTYSKFNSIKIYIVMLIFNYINCLLKSDTISMSLVNKLTFLVTVEIKVLNFIEYIQYSDKYDKDIMNRAINILNESFQLVQNQKMIISNEDSEYQNDVL